MLVEPFFGRRAGCVGRRGGEGRGAGLRTGLAAQRDGLHLLGDVVHVGDVGPPLGIGADAHIYQLSQLKEREEHGLCERLSRPPSLPLRLHSLPDSAA